MRKKGMGREREGKRERGGKEDKEEDKGLLWERRPSGVIKEELFEPFSSYIHGSLF